MKTLKEQIKCKCIHFTGMMNKTCKAGMNYQEVADPGSRPIKLPCFKEGEMSGGNCDKSEFLSDEEATKKANEIKSDGAKTMLAMIAVKEHVRSMGTIVGNIKCPSCGGELKYAQAPNKHTRGNCACGINWIE